MGRSHRRLLINERMRLRLIKMADVRVLFSISLTYYLVFVLKHDYCFTDVPSGAESPATNYYFSVHSKDLEVV